MAITVLDTDIAEWHSKRVRKRGEITEYIVSAAMRDDDGRIVIALLSTEYSQSNKDWTTYYLTDDEFLSFVGDLNVIGNGVENDWLPIVQRGLGL